MKRRDILKYTAFVTGAALSAPLLLSLESCKADNGQLGKDVLSFFDSDKMKLVSSITDTILPKTDSPSASEVGVPSMIDHMVGNVYPEEARQSYEANFNELVSFLNGKSEGKGFQGLSDEEKMEVLKNLSNSNGENILSAKKGLLDLKQQTIAYYLNTEEVAINFLNYLPTPGPYEGCISLESVGGKAWAI